MYPSDQDIALAQILLDHSVAIKPKEKVLISVSTLALPLGKAVFQETVKRGAYPLLDVDVPGMAFSFFQYANDWQVGYVPAEVVKAKIKWADAFIRLFADDNSRELAGVDPAKLQTRAKLMRPLTDPMIDSDRWILTMYPTPSMAQEAGVSYDWLREFYFRACLVDYQKMKRELQALAKMMDGGKMIRVQGKQTDLWVDISGRLAQPCFGERNIPDGECFLAPVTNGVNGEVYVDLPTLAYGREVQGIHLEFKEGKVVKAFAERGDEQLQQMLATDPGARILGEFAIGANFNIKQAMMNTLFDEKIGGTIHMALGRSYREKRGGGENESAIHWDIVKDMRLPGSVLTIDEKVVLKNGKFVI